MNYSNRDHNLNWICTQITYFPNTFDTYIKMNIVKFSQQFTEFLVDKFCIHCTAKRGLQHGSLATNLSPQLEQQV